MATRRYPPQFKKNSFEIAAWADQKVVCGTDEAGRGCLAGPVVIAAAITPINTSYRLLKDSKTLSKQEIAKAYAWIQKRCFFSWVSLNNRQIDTLNIYQATLQGMKRALLQLFASCPLQPVKILVDAMPVNLEHTNYHGIDVAYFTQGEKKSVSIAAASIVAKFKRDQLMEHLHSVFPLYTFDKHKGYGTKQHQKALQEYGASIIHRNSFLTHKVFPREHYNEYKQQQTIG